MQKKLLKIAAVFAVLAVIGIGVVYWMTSSSNTTDFDGKRTVYIARNASFDSVVDSLSSAGILGDAASFKLFGSLTGWGNQVKAGHYAFESGASNRDLLSTLRRGLQEPVNVVIPPGSRKEVVAAVVAKHMEFSKQDFLNALVDTELAAELGTDTTSIFGFMLPDTYSFYWLTDAPTVVKRVKKYFDDFYKKEYAGNPLGLDLSPTDVASVAALVEWESNHNEEKPTIAGVYLNRLRDQWLLQADPTVQFALLQTEGRKRRLFFRDYKIDHPYNTYIYRGLPPGPVTNPSRSSIRAALRPEAHSYYYFVTNGNGSHVFSKTLREHNNAAKRFYALQRARRQASSS